MILPPETVKHMTEIGWPALVTTAPAVPLTSPEWTSHLDHL